MSMQRLAGVIAGVLLALGLLATSANAGQGNQATVLTIQQPMRIPGHVLQPGTYFFTRVDDGQNSDTNLILVYNQDRTHLIAMVMTQPVERLYVSGKTVLTFAEGPAAQPVALVDWFYPGSLEGHQFLYSPNREHQIEQERQIILASNSKGTVVVHNLSGRPS